MARVRILLAAAVLLAAGGGLPAAVAADGNKSSDYTVAELLNPCFEADNDARRGAAAEAECEQYLTGFTDALAVTGNLGPEQGICLPDVNRPDEMRWAYMRWVHEHYDRRREIAANGLMDALKDKFPCQ